MPGQRRPPIVVGLLINMIFASLPRRGCREEQKAASVASETVSEVIGRLRHNVFGNLQRLHEIELPPQIEISIEIDRGELRLRYLQRCTIHVITVNAMSVGDATFDPGAKPGS